MARKYTQNGRMMHVKFANLGDDDLLLDGFHGTENVSRLSVFHLDLLAELPLPGDLSFDKVLGQPVTAVFALPDGGTRSLAGIVRRFSRGVVYQGNYTWSKALGESEGIAQFYDAGYRNNRDLSFDKRILNFNRTHAFKSNGIWELPVGKGHAVLGNAGKLLNAVVGGWKVALPDDTLSQLKFMPPLSSYRRNTC